MRIDSQFLLLRARDVAGSCSSTARTLLHDSGRRRTCTLLLVASLLASHAGPSHAALCGDTNGNGFVTAADARLTLTLAVRNGYDRRGDVAPAGGDGLIRAVDALVTLRSAVNDSFPACSGWIAKRAAVTTAPFDFSSGGFATIALGPDVVTEREVVFRSGALSPDSVVRAPSGTPLVVNRNRYNTLQFLDVEDDDLPTVNECSVADGFNSNPQDVLLYSADEGFVTPYAGSELLVIDPKVLFDPHLDPSCSTIVKSRIDLAAFDDDGVPEMDQMAVAGGKLFVSLQRLDGNHKPTQGFGEVVVIDPVTRSVQKSIALSFANPFAATKGLAVDEFRHLLFVGGPGTIGDVLDDGGIEAIDLETLESAGMLLTGADIGANIFDFVIAGSDRAFAIVADEDSNSVVEIDLAKRKVRKVLLSSTALITDIEMTERGELWVAYRGESKADPPGIRIFRLSNTSVAMDRYDPELTAKPIHVGLAPFTLAFFP
jgi:hypothetical protein